MSYGDFVSKAIYWVYTTVHVWDIQVLWHVSCFVGEIKTLMIQLLRAVTHLHDNWILHRDLKASNLLLSNKGILKVSSD